jgi:dihydrofolate synthase/folylpolyglutamate synthase
VQLIEQIYALQERHPATFFEATTAAAFLAFAETSADIVLLETGMGGRLDATNMLDAPAATIIMPIGMDHAEYLGETIAKIAAEKAAIMKPGVPSIIAPQTQEAAAVIAAHAQAIGASLLRAGQEWQFSHIAGNTWNYQGIGRPLSDLPIPALIGAHQLPNAATAVAALEQLQRQYLAITHKTIAAGLTSAKWPARLQQLEDGYWRKQLPESFALYLDGGHNPMASQRLAEWTNAQSKPVYLVAGMLNTKDAMGFLRPWRDIAQAVHCVTIPDEPSSQDAVALQSTAQSCGLTAFAEASIEFALQRIAENASGIVLICGSLYLAGHVLSRQEMPSD